MSHTAMESSRIMAVLLDISGTIQSGSSNPIDGAEQAVQKLFDNGIAVKFLTNTSKISTRTLLNQLHDIGFTMVNSENLITSVVATQKYLQNNNLKPFCLVEDTSDFDGKVDLSPPHNCVVVGLAPQKLDYHHLNLAFRILQRSPNLIAIHRANYLRVDDGELSLGPGGFVSCLEAAAETEAVVVGKPSKLFFESALWEGIDKENVCMVGDDAIQDIEGAIRAGLGHTILVKTGKYRDGDESKTNASALADSIVEAVEYILQQGRV